MASIQVRKETGFLIIDFYYKGTRCREQTILPDTSANRKRVQKVLDRIEAEISGGTFEYSRVFPGSKNAKKFEELHKVEFAPTQIANSVVAALGQQSMQSQISIVTTPLVKEFAETWYAEKEVEWRNSHKKGIRADINSRILPRWGEIEVGRITKADILAFRADLAKEPARGKGRVLSNRRINKILNLLRQVVNEAAERFGFRTPFLNIKQLKVRRTDVDPFTLEEVMKILAKVRDDFRSYYTVRFFTGMRSGEVNGLKWKYVDFERRLILVRETIVLGEDEYTKNDSSQRDIQMSQMVYEALKKQERVKREDSEYVFFTRNGTPLDNKNVTDRVWKPLLRHLDLKVRRAYQTRHTAATLWLGAGENPEWIARQMGHTTTEMLFRVYSRYVPNLTRQDGSAFERLIMQSGGVTSESNVETEKQSKTEGEANNHG